MSVEMLKYLGAIGDQLPKLTSKEWTVIFEFLEYFTLVGEINFSLKKEEDTFLPNQAEFNWAKVREVLLLLGKIEDWKKLKMRKPKSQEHKKKIRGLKLWKDTQENL